MKHISPVAFYDTIDRSQSPFDLFDPKLKKPNGILSTPSHSALRGAAPSFTWRPFAM